MKAIILIWYIIMAIAISVSLSYLAYSMAYKDFLLFGLAILCLISNLLSYAVIYDFGITKMTDD